MKLKQLQKSNLIIFLIIFLFLIFIIPIILRYYLKKKARFFERFGNVEDFISVDDEIKNRVYKSKNQNCYNAHYDIENIIRNNVLQQYKEKYGKEYDPDDIYLGDGQIKFIQNIVQSFSCNDLIQTKERNMLDIKAAIRKKLESDTYCKTYFENYLKKNPQTFEGESNTIEHIMIIKINQIIEELNKLYKKTYGSDIDFVTITNPQKEYLIEIIENITKCDIMTDPQNLKAGEFTSEHSKRIEYVSDNVIDPQKFLKKNKLDFSIDDEPKIDMTKYIAKTQVKSCNNCKKKWGTDKPLLYDLHNPNNSANLENDFILSKDLNYSFIDEHNIPIWN